MRLADMKIPSNPFPNRRSPRRILNNYKSRLRKAQKALEGECDYTPLIAKQLATILLDLAAEGEPRRQAVLRVFTRIVNQE